jgi:uncharacterized protein
MKIRRACFAVVGAALALPATAAAHVTLNPNEAPAGSFSRFAIRVPTERPDADTVKVTVRLPAGLTFVGFQPKAGWKRTVTMAKVSPPMEVFGQKITERVATVTWSGGRIAPGEFDEFGMSVRVPETTGRQLVFPSLQTYSSGEVVRWIGPPDSDEPAPRVRLTAAEEAAPAPAAESSDEDGDTRANVALVLGAAGLGAGLLALGLAVWRRRL